jgi:hypothetical protein
MAIPDGRYSLLKAFKKKTNPAAMLVKLSPIFATEVKPLLLSKVINYPTTRNATYFLYCIIIIMSYISSQKPRKRPLLWWNFKN